jgi:hypothetical protein
MEIGPYEKGLVRYKKTWSGNKKMGQISREPEKNKEID